MICIKIFDEYLEVDWRQNYSQSYWISGFVYTSLWLNIFVPWIYVALILTN